MALAKFGMTLFWACVVFMLTSAAPAVASKSSSSTSNSTIYHDTYTHSADKHVREYWTADRIANIDHDPAAEHPVIIPADERARGAEFDESDALELTIGRLFSTLVDEDDGTETDSSCTATLVRGKNKATLITAAHCITNNGNVTFTKNNLWIPGYRDGAAPHGKFTVNTIVLSSLWRKGDFSRLQYDHAFLVLNPDLNGRSAGQILGQGQDIGFNRAVSARRYQFGYPRYASQAPPNPPQSGNPAFIGERLAYCSGRIMNWSSGHGLTGLSCAMGGGASGGPHIQDLNLKTGFGTIVAVNSLSDVVKGKGGDVDYLWGASVTDPLTEELFQVAEVIIP